MFILYSMFAELAVWMLLLPFELLLLLSGRSDGERVRQLMGWARLQVQGAHPTILVHAVSAGEVAAAEPVIRELLVSRPGLEVVLTTSSPAGLAAAQAVQGRIPGIGIVTLLPWDRRWAMRRWLKMLAPQVVVTVETEIWPNLFRECRRRGTALAIVNGRIYPRDVARYRLIRPFMHRVLDYANWIGVQDATEGQRLVDIGAAAARVEVTGNVKFDLHPNEHPGPAIAGPGTLLVAGSTHGPEERWMLQVFADLRPAHAQLRLVLAPRNSGRGRSLEKQAEQAGFRVHRWSAGGWEQGGWDVLILDTIGQLMPFYAGADVVLMGGSLANCGGHNILEPAALGRPILVGPHMENFQGILECFLAHEALLQVAGPQGLEQALGQLLAEPELCRRLGERARRCVETERGAAERSTRAVLGLMEQEAKIQGKS